MISKSRRVRNTLSFLRFLSGSLLPLPSLRPFSSRSIRYEIANCYCSSFLEISSKYLSHPYPCQYQYLLPLPSLRLSSSRSIKYQIAIVGPLFFLEISSKYFSHPYPYQYRLALPSLRLTSSKSIMYEIAIIHFQYSYIHTLHLLRIALASQRGSLRWML